MLIENGDSLRQTHLQTNMFWDNCAKTLPKDTENLSQSPSSAGLV